MFITYWLILSGAIVCIANPFNKNSELLSVIQIFRHGQRVPIEFYPTDPYANLSFWEASPGQLTKKGKFQAYDLGLYTRQRYESFLPSVYSEKDFYAYTTDVDRTHMSAQAYIAGLYPPTEENMWHPYVHWIPIPVHPAPQPILQFKDCPLFFDLAASTTQTVYEEYLLKNRELLEYVSSYSGVDVSNYTGMGFVADALFIEKDVGLPLPKWTQVDFIEPLEDAVLFLIGERGLSDILKRLGNGPFLNMVVETFEKKLQNPNSGRKLTAYSGHDINLIGLLKTLGYDYKPKFSSSIYFELWRYKKTPYVNIYFKNGYTIYPIKAGECDFNCKLDDFKLSLNKYIINEETFNRECYVNSDKSPYTSNCIPNNNKEG